MAAISWKVEEAGVANYAVEKSDDAIHFRSFKTISSAGNGTHSYQTTDPEKVQNNAYYRILQTDVDGRNSYSAVIKINTSAAQATIYPTVFTNGFTVNANAAATAQLIDAQGRLVRNIKLSASSNYIAADDLAKGVYIIVFENGLRQRIIKQ